jgi:quinol monooxygenase YgiN
MKSELKLHALSLWLAGYLQITISMILIIMRMKALCEKRLELSQTVGSLIGSLRREQGCRRCDSYRSMENENELCILKEWDTQANLNTHLKSEHFGILLGAMNLLQEPYERVFHTVAAARAKRKVL